MNAAAAVRGIRESMGEAEERRHQTTGTGSSDYLNISDQPVLAIARQKAAGSFHAAEPCRFSRTFLAPASRPRLR